MSILGESKVDIYNIGGIIMAKVSFSKLKLPKPTDVEVIEFNGESIEVKKYISIDDRNALITAAVVDAIGDNFINPVLLDKHFHLNLVYKSTNISFTEKQREDEGALYDQLLSSGLLDEILLAIGDENYKEIFGQCVEYANKFETSANSLYGILSSIIGSVPQSMAEAMEKVSEFDTSKLSGILEMTSKNFGSPDAGLADMANLNETPRPAKPSDD